MREGILIPDRFRRRIVVHAFTVHAHVHYPMLLAIQGAPGDGKTFQLGAALETAGFMPYRLSGAMLGGSYEGEGVRQLRDTYASAAAHSAGAIVLEDFDLSPAGEREGVRYTVNSQMLAGFLMNLADDPGACGVGTSARVPIFITANDLTTVHGPLLRPGRMELFDWVPTEEERAMMFRSVLIQAIPGVTLEHCAQLARTHRAATVATVAAALNRCIADHVDTLLAQPTGFGVTIQSIRLSLASESGVRFENVAAAMQGVLKEHSAKNFLRRALSNGQRSKANA